MERGVRVFAYPQHLQVSSHWPAITILASDWLIVTQYSPLIGCRSPRSCSGTWRPPSPSSSPCSPAACCPCSRTSTGTTHTNIFLVSKYFYLYLSTNRDFLRAFVGIEMEARGQPDNPVPDILGIPIDQVLDIYLHNIYTISIQYLHNIYTLSTQEPPVYPVCWRATAPPTATAMTWCGR